MASFFSGLLASLKVTFFAPSRTEVPSSSTELHNNGMPSFGLPSMDETVNDHSKIEKAEEAKDEVAASTNENGELAQSTADQPNQKPSNGQELPLPNGNCTSPVEVEGQQMSVSVVLEKLQTDTDLSSDQTEVQLQTEMSSDQTEVSTTDQEDSPWPDETCTTSEPIIDTNTDHPEPEEFSEGISSIEATHEGSEESHIEDTAMTHSEDSAPTVESDTTETDIVASDMTQSEETDLVTDSQFDQKTVDSVESQGDQQTDSVESQGDHQTDFVESAGSETIPLVLDDIGSLMEVYGSPMVVDEQEGPNYCQFLDDQPPLPQLNLIEEASLASLTVEGAVSESVVMTYEQESFESAMSNLLSESVEPMEVDSLSDATATIVEAQSDTSGVGSAEGESPDEVTAEPQTNMSGEDTDAIVAHVGPPPAVFGALSVEEKPLTGGKPTYSIDWDKFDENTVPNPFGKPVPRRLPGATGRGRGRGGGDGGGGPHLPPPPGPASDNNANELNPVGTSAKTQEDKPPAPEKTNEDVKNSNVAPGEATSDTQLLSQNKENVIRHTPTKGPRPSPQQTAVVAPTVHVAATVGSDNEVDNTSTASRNAFRRPPIKTNASVNATVQQTVPMPAQNNRHLSPKGARSGDESISEEEMFVMASSDPFNDSAAFEYLQQAGGASRPANGESNLHRQSLYQKFDPLVSGDNAVASGSETKQRRQQQPPAPGITDEVISVGDVTFTERDELLLINTPSPVRDQNDSAAAPSTVVKKKHGPKVQSGSSEGPAQSDAAETDRLLSISPEKKTHAPAASSSGHEVKQQFQALLMAKEKEFHLRLEEEKLKRMQLEMELTSVKNEAEAAKQNSSEMSFVVAEYEKTVRQLIAEKDKPKQNRLSGEYELVVKERDQALDDLQTVENAFSELNRRYETLRSSAAEFKKNEEVLKSSLADYQHKLKKSEEKFNKLYAHAEHKLEQANQEIERQQKAKETDTLALRATLKKRELQVETLEKNLEQKQKEIQELTSICDELIQKAGGH